MSDGGRQDIIIYNTSDGRITVSLYARDGTVWMNQSQLKKKTRPILIVNSHNRSAVGFFQGFLKKY